MSIKVGTFAFAVILNATIAQFLLSKSTDENSLKEVVNQPCESDNTGSTDSFEKDTKKHFNVLILGGGYSPSGNQVSLESNVKYFHRIRNKFGFNEASCKTLFADGNDPSRDIQFFDPSFKVPEATKLLASIMGTKRGLFNQYRNNRVKTNGNSSIGEIDKWIREANSTSKNSTNLIYFTGHGGKGDKKNPKNTTALLWENVRLKVSDLSKKLDRLPDSHKSILIMVQCYSGGFANIIFKDGNPKEGLSNQHRAGFFATVHDRVAAGCTPDIREANYREYSTQFWEALCGESRLGEKGKKPDFDCDGKTSLTEAHAYVIINSETIDVPIKTSDVFLRNFVDFDNNKTLNESNASKGQLKQDHGAPYFDPKDSLKHIAENATPTAKAIIHELAKKLNLELSSPYSELSKKTSILEKKRSAIVAKKKERETERNKIRNNLKNLIKKEWPELTNMLHPAAHKLQTHEQAKAFLSFANQEMQWSKFNEVQKEVDDLENERFDVEKNQVITMRLKWELENVFLRKELLQKCNPSIVKRFENLLELENLCLEEIY